MKKFAVIIALVVGFVAGSYFMPGINLQTEKTQDDLIKEYYDVETAVSVSPHGLRTKMMKGDDSFILVDLRSQKEYEESHIAGAISIPAYKDRENSAYGDVERIVNSFRELDSTKEIITYCYSVACMTSRKVGKILSDNDIYVKHLNVGWNEWRYHWNTWNHEHEWEISNAEDYVVSGTQSGVPNIKIDPNSKGACPIDNSLGC